jgi:plasmid stabilization system protein ParE
MVKEVIWTPTAQKTFNQVIDYLNEKWTESEIINFVSSTDRIVDYIVQNPKMFRKTNKKNIHEAVVTPHNLLIYKIYPTRIYLVTFWDTRRNPKKKK